MKKTVWYKVLSFVKQNKYIHPKYKLCYGGVGIREEWSFNYLWIQHANPPPTPTPYASHLDLIF